MFYPKNVPNIERAARVMIGVVLIGVAILNQSLLQGATLLGIGLIVFSAVFVIVTGFVGWCPACALVGRKLKSNDRREPQR